jgi:hypothetical protein
MIMLSMAQSPAAAAPRTCGPLSTGCALLLAWSVQAGAAWAVPTVWSGFGVTFTRPAAGPPTDPANQDRITDNVWLTRDSTQGIFNIKQEMSYDIGIHHAPADTRWATDLNNAGKTIAAANYEDLTFTFWREAYGGAVATTIINRNAVVHLVTDDIYLDLRFTDWGVQGAGGFAYMRAVAPSLPAPTGDYNANGTVDAADYVLWRDTFGQPADPTGSGADGSANGTIDDADFDFWKARFGNAVPTALSGISSIAAPEPATIVVAVGFTGMLVLSIRIAPCRRRRGFATGRRL